MPSVKSLDKQEYYAHPQNQFWKIIGTLFNIDYPSNYEYRKKCILKNGIAVWDVINSCKREGSLDSNIKNENINALEEFLIQYPNIHTIFTNGQRAYQLLIKHYPINTVNIICLPSTSPTYTKPYQWKLQQWRVIKKYVRKN